MALLNYPFISSRHRRRHYHLVVFWAGSNLWIDVRNRHSCSSSWRRRYLLRRRRPVFWGPSTRARYGSGRRSCSSSFRPSRHRRVPSWAVYNHVISGRIGYSYSRLVRRRRRHRRPAFWVPDSPWIDGFGRRSCSRSVRRLRRRLASLVPNSLGTGVLYRRNCSSFFLLRRRRRLRRPNLNQWACACSGLLL